MDKTDDKHELIMTIVNRGFSDAVMDAARARGARGGTILHGRGTAAKETEQFFNIGLGNEKEAVLIVAAAESRSNIMDGIMRAERFGTDAQGVIFSLPVEEFVLMSKLRGADSSADNGAEKKPAEAGEPREKTRAGGVADGGKQDGADMLNKVDLN